MSEELKVQKDNFMLVDYNSLMTIRDEAYKTLGLDKIASAIPSLCFIPNEYLDTLSYILFLRPTNSITSSILSRLTSFFKLAINLKFL